MPEDSLMRPNEQQVGMIRTVTVRLPTGETAYWFTDRVFVVGDTLSHKRHSWTVAEVQENQSDSSLAVTLIEADQR